MSQNLAGYEFRWRALPVILAGVLLVIMDIFILYVATPSIQASLHASFAESQLIVAGYHLTYAVFLITGGRLGDIFGRKRVFMFGLGGFTLASALCGVAPTAGALIFARILQGMMAALLFPQVLSMIRVLFLPQELKTAFGCYGGVLGLASIAGQVLGGLLIHWNWLGLEWRPIFFINVPIGIVAMIVANKLLPESKSKEATKLDPVGVGLATAGLFLLIYALTEGHHAGWPGWAFGCLGLSIPTLTLFWHIQKKKASKRDSPLIQTELFRDRAFVVGLLIAFMFYMGTPSFWVLLTYYFQQGLGLDAWSTAKIFVPCSLGVALSAFLSPILVSKMGRYVLSLGAILQIGGVAALMGMVLSQSSLGGPYLAISMFVLGLGQGLTISPLVNTVLASIRSEHIGSAAGVLTTFQQLGGAVGVAIVGSAYSSLLAAKHSYAQSLANGLLFHLAFFVSICVFVFLLPRPAAAARKIEPPKTERVPIVHQGAIPSPRT